MLFLSKKIPNLISIIIPDKRTYISKTKRSSFEDNLLLTKPAIGVDSLLIFFMTPGLSLLIKLKVNKETRYAITRVPISI